MQGNTNLNLQRNIFPGCICLVIGLTMMYLPELNTLTCTRYLSLVECQYRSKSLYETKTIKLAPGELLRAEVELGRSDRGSRPSRVLLITRGRDIPFRSYYSDLTRSQDQNDVKQINRFINNSSQKNITIRKNPSLVILFIALLMLGAGVHNISAVVYHLLWTRNREAR